MLASRLEHRIQKNDNRYNKKKNQPTKRTTLGGGG
jgi:hypothetical protein